MNLSVLVNSCDAYSYLWDGFVYFFNKRWEPDHKEVPRFFLSNDIRVDYPGFRNVRTGKTGFSGSVRTVLNSADTDYVFWMQDDYFLTKPVSEKWLEHSLSIMENNRIDLLTFQGIGGLITINSEDTLDNGKLKRVTQDSKYTTSLQPGIWNRRFFLMCLGDKDFNPWEFEKKGCKYLNTYFRHKIYVNDVDQPLCPSSGVVKGGKPRPAYYKMMRQKEQNK